MKKKKYKITRQIFTLFFLLAAIILGCVFIFQSVFLKSIYKNNKINTLSIISKEIETSIYNKNLTQTLFNVSLSNEVCALVITKDYKFDGYSNSNGCILSRLSAENLNDIYNLILKNDKELLFEDLPFLSSVYDGPDNIKAFIYGRILKSDPSTLILVSSVITPINTTISTIQSQYLAIFIIVIIATCVVAFIASNLLIRPIKYMTHEVSKLPYGKYKGNFNTNNLEYSILNDALIRTNERINIAEKTKMELLANVTHDLKTPLTMIEGHAEMIKDIPECDVKKSCDIIISESERLSNLVNDLLEYSKSHSNNLSFHIEPFKLKTILKEVYVQYKDYCKKEKITLKLNIKYDLIINSDEFRLKQVINNFINNAINYNDKDTKIIEIGIEKITDDQYMVYVYDNGKGIKTDDIDLVWDRYYKVDKEHKRSKMGSGIGLSLSKQILEKLELKYGVESIYKQYSRFYFLLDLKHLKR